MLAPLLPVPRDALNKRHISSRSQIALNKRDPTLHETHTHFPVEICPIVTTSQPLLQTRPVFKTSNAKARRRERRSNMPVVQAKKADFWQRNAAMQHAALCAALHQSTAAQEEATPPAPLQVLFIRRTTVGDRVGAGCARSVTVTVSWSTPSCSMLASLKDGRLELSQNSSLLAAIGCSAEAGVPVMRTNVSAPRLSQVINRHTKCCRR